MTPDERAGLSQAIANGPDDMAWPSKTVSELLDDIEAAETQRDQWRRDFFKSSVQCGEVMQAAAERDAALGANMRLAYERDDAEAALAHAVTEIRGLMAAAEKLLLDWPKPGAPANRQAVTRAIRSVETLLARLPAAAEEDR